MLHDIVTKGSIDRSVTVKIVDSADGTPETGVVFNTSGIDLWYRREGAALTSITEATLAALTTAHTDGGFLHVAHGVYRLDLPDAAFATAANYVDFGGTVTGMVVIGGRVRLVDYSLEDSVRMGLTALPNAAAESAGGLYTRGSGAGQINQPANGRVDVNAVALAADVITAAATAADFTTEIQAGLATAANLAIVDDFLDTEIADIQSRLPAALVSGRIDASVGAMAANVLTAAATAADFTTEIQSGLATAASLATIDDFLDTEIADIKAYADRTVVRGTVSGTAPTTTTFTSSALSPVGVAADQFKGRIIVFDNDTMTTSLRGQATDITASSAASNPLFTFTALTTAPQSGDTFSVL